MSSELFIGLMSGTSMDAIDCALVDLNNKPQNYLLDFINVEIPTKLKINLQNLCNEPKVSLRLLGETDSAMAEIFASAASAILEKNHIAAHQIRAIGSHGQTIYHQPPGQGEYAFSMQIADPNRISASTGITTVADFRRKDIAMGGQGAPLLPVFHQHLFGNTQKNRIILNIGGMANITIMRKNEQKIIGFDTGPGNILLDSWIQAQKKIPYDDQGAWAASGDCQPHLLSFLLEDLYFSKPPPKSTGREYFNLNWLRKYLEDFGKEISAQDIQATLVSLSSKSISMAIRELVDTGEVIACGGGASNTFLMQKLHEDLPGFILGTSDDFGVNSNALEALAFAWFAKQTLDQAVLDFRKVTGASRPAILGGIYYGE
jgi:anhydro-N-acetylmuramic acid kinase